MINAHVHNLLIHKGSQWVVFDPTVVVLYGFEGAPYVEKESQIKLSSSKLI